jgi:Peptidase A4 family
MIIRVAGTTIAALALVAGTSAFGSQPAAHQSQARHASARQTSPRPSTHPMIPARLPAGQAATASAIGNVKTVGSTNWAGYAVNKKGVKFRKISATFFVPFLNCAASPGGTFSSAWVGLDGFSNGTVEQDGISADCNGSTPQYAAWYETFPSPEVQTRIVIHHGDSITATVTFNSSTSKFRMAVTDNTDHHHFAVSRKCRTCKRTSAEVISEAPTIISGGTATQASLADYGAESFNSIAITSSAGRSAGITSTHWNRTKIVEVGFSSHAPIAFPTALHGPSFDNYWLGEK